PQWKARWPAAEPAGLSVAEDRTPPATGPMQRSQTSDIDSKPCSTGPRIFPRQDDSGVKVFPLADDKLWGRGSPRRTRRFAPGTPISPPFALTSQLRTKAPEQSFASPKWTHA